MQDGRDAAWREAFDDLLVFEQDFDTAMQILMFQDEKVARLALEDPQETRSQRARRAKTRRGSRSPSRKRRRTETSQAERPEPPTQPLSTFPQSCELPSPSPFDGEDATQTQDSSMPTTQLTDVSVGIDRTDRIMQLKQDTHSKKDEDTDGGTAFSTTGGTINLPTFFTTGSGKNAQVSKSSLSAYERKMQLEEEKVASGTTASSSTGLPSAGTSLAVPSSAGTTVATMFATGSGKNVQVSKSSLSAYERKMQLEEEKVASGTTASSSTGLPSAGTSLAGTSLAVPSSAGTTVATMFATGSGKNVQVSKSSLSAYERKMQLEEEKVASGTTASSSTGLPSAGTSLAGTSLAVPSSAGTTVATMFATGSGKNVQVSKSSLSAYERKMQLEEEKVASGTTASSSTGLPSAGTSLAVPSSAGTTVATMFATGSGKNVQVSKSSLSAYERKMQLEEEKVASGTTASSSTGLPSAGTSLAGTSLAVPSSAGTTVATMFATGSGKNVQVSKSSLSAYERKMQLEEEKVASGTTASSSTGLPSAGTSLAGTSLAVPSSAGTTVATMFATGSGKNVQVSKSSLSAYERKMQLEEEKVASGTTASSSTGLPSAGTSLAVPSSAGTTVATMFATGSGKNVQVSKSSLSAYERKMQLEEEKVASGTTASSSTGLPSAGTSLAGTSLAVPSSAGTTVATMFATGSGKNVQVSKSSLSAYERKMQLEEEKVASGTTASSSTGLPSAGTSLAGTSLAVPSSAGTTVATMFATGSGKNVQVSKSSLSAYERKMQLEEEKVASGTTASSSTGLPSAGTSLAGTSLAVPSSAGTTVATMFATGSGKNVQVSKSSLSAYERKMQLEEEKVASGTTASSSTGLPSAGTSLAGTSLAVPSSAGTTVATMFATGSGKNVQVSKSSLSAYERKMQLEEEKVASGTTASSSTGLPSAGTSLASSLCVTKRKMELEGETCGGSSTNVVGGSTIVADPGAVITASMAVSTFYVVKRTSSTLGKVTKVVGVDRGRRTSQISASNECALARGDRSATVPSDGSRNVAYPLRLDCGDKENVHPENVVVRKTASLEASKSWRSRLSSKQLHSRLSVQYPEHQNSLQRNTSRRPLKPSIEPRSKMIGKRRFHPPVASKRLCASDSKSFHDVGRPTAPRSKKQKEIDTEAHPFIYEESMKISLTTLIGLRGDHSLGDGDYELPRLQVLNCITAENALKVRFAHDGNLIFSSDESYATSLYTGPRELYHQLRAGNHILKKTGATFAWFLNHYRWIVWKLAATERSFPRLLFEKYLTKDQVLKQVTHRYQRDLNDAQRSVLKRILQRDGSSLSCMVFCVAAVLPFSSGSTDQELPAWWNMALVLTDGWYSVYAVPDAPLSAVLWKLHAKSGLVGTKLATWNASLQNSTEGIDPLECAIVLEAQWRNPLLAKEDLSQWPYLQLRYNSTRRVRFDTRLGVEKLHYVVPSNPRHQNQQPQLTFSLLKSVPLKSLEVGGGMVRSVRVRVTRISPVLHLQSKEWTLGPRTLCEEQLPLYFELRSEYARVVMEKQHQQDGESSRSDDLLGDDQIDVPPPIPFIKVDVECTHSSSNEHQGVGCGILTIWRPSEELLSGGLREGAEYFATSLTVNWKLDGGRGQDASLRLSSTKHSGFEEVHDEVSLADNDRSQRLCVDVQQATMDYRANFEDGLNGRRNERRPIIDVCVCVVLIAARETQDDSSSSVKRQAEVSLLDPKMRPKESRYVEHVFVTDQSCHLMSIRVSGMEASMPKKKSSSPLKRATSSSFVFRRGSKNVWKEGAILCLSGLEVSHYDEQLRVLDCVLVESTRIVSFPSKKSPFWDHFQLLQREAGISTIRGFAPTSGNFAKELAQLKKYVERDILGIEFVPSQECAEHHVEVVEQKRLTQDLQAHEEGGERATVEQGDDGSPKAQNRRLRWDAHVVKVLPLVGANKFMFPRDVVAFACVNVGTDDKAFRTVYLTRDIVLLMQGLLQEDGATQQLCQQEDGVTATNAAFVESVTDMLGQVKEDNADYAFRFEVRQFTNERLINSWKPWERLHASYWLAVTVASPTAK